MTTTTRAPRIATDRDGREVRTFRSTLEARDDGGLAYVIEGVAAATGVAYSMGAYEEVVAPGAFSETLAKRPEVVMLTNHEGLPLAKSSIPPGSPGHLGLSEDSNGLRVFAQLDRDDPEAVTLVRKIRSGLMSDMSFAFRVERQSWSADRTLRTIESVDLHRGDVSVCTFGANPNTSVTARSRTGRRGSSLATYQARARALELAGPRTKAGRRTSRSPMTAADINDLPDSAFAYIEPGGKKDSGGKTVPRSLRHYPIHDAPRVRNALARAAAAIQAGGAAAAIAKKAMPAIKAAAKKMGIGEPAKKSATGYETARRTGNVRTFQYRAEALRLRTGRR